MSKAQKKSSKILICPFNLKNHNSNSNPLNPQIPSQKTFYSPTHIFTFNSIRLSFFISLISMRSKQVEKNYFWRCTKIIVNLIYLCHPSLEEIIEMNENLLPFLKAYRQMASTRKFPKDKFFNFLRGDFFLSSLLFNKKILLFELFRWEWDSKRKEMRYEDDGILSFNF